jgi:hypothetical protein
LGSIKVAAIKVIRVGAGTTEAGNIIIMQSFLTVKKDSQLNCATWDAFVKNSRKSNIIEKKISKFIIFSINF